MPEKNSHRGFKKTGIYFLMREAKTGTEEKDYEIDQCFREKENYPFL